MRDSKLKNLIHQRRIRPIYSTWVGEDVIDPFVQVTEDKNGSLEEIHFLQSEKFNFAFDIVDKIAERSPGKLAMIHLDKEKTERRFRFHDMKRFSNQAANYLLSLGVKKGDAVMLVMKRHWQFWPVILACHKIGAIAIPATHQLKKDDFVYRFMTANVHSIFCTADDDTAEQVDAACEEYKGIRNRIMIGNKRDGWNDFNTEFIFHSEHFQRTSTSPCGNETMILFFTSGTTNYPKIVKHSYTYALAHYITAKYWHSVKKDGLHFTIADTGWGKALWGKLYGQWLCEAAVFTYDFDRFDAQDILPLISQYQVTSFCAPPTIYRMLIRQEISRFDFASVEHAVTAGEAVNPEVLRIFKERTGLEIYDGFGQTETILTIANLKGKKQKLGSMGLAVPSFDIRLLNDSDEEVEIGEHGEICIKTSDSIPCGLMLGYSDENLNEAAWHNGYYHTGDMAWKDEEGYFWYVGRKDDIINSSGYRIGPLEVENVIIELPYVLECAVVGAADSVRGTVVKACVVLAEGSQACEECKREIQNFVKSKTAPYKYPRIVEFYESLPKSVGGKIQRRFL